MVASASNGGIGREGGGAPLAAGGEIRVIEDATGGVRDLGVGSKGGRESAVMDPGIHPFGVARIGFEGALAKTTGDGVRGGGHGCTQGNGATSVTKVGGKSLYLGKS